MGYLILIVRVLSPMYCAGTAVPISSANAKGDMRMVISRRR